MAAIITDFYTNRGLTPETAPNATIGSDHEPFAAAGIPVGGFYGGTIGIKTTAEKVSTAVRPARCTIRAITRNATRSRT